VKSRPAHPHHGEKQHAAETVLWPALAKFLPNYPDINVEVIIDKRLDRYRRGPL